MAASSSSSAAAEPRLHKHHVFLSFRGEDTRTKFASHLYSALSKICITYKDDENLKIGDTISPALKEAIEESEISIIIFSENYASSSWCLEELVHILKCKKEKARIVLPIFLGVDPSNIRKQKVSYADAFVEHEKGSKKEKVPQWRRALEEAAGLSGWDSRKMSESEIVEEVVECVRTELDSIKSKRSGDFNGLVGIPERLEKIKSFLDSPTVLIIGIWGMGGIGKTTLAKAVFNQFYNDFEGSYFVHSVRENVIINKGVEKLEKKMYSKLLGEKNLNIFKSSDVNDRLSRRRILLVLDDVETPMQLRHLVGEPDRFCLGSKIIVTSRRKLLVDAEYNAEYEVEVLDFDDARKLFYLNAFGDKSCRRGYEERSDRVVEYTKGHPLALKVLGASVFYILESKEAWEKELEKLKRIPNDQIQNVLEISYDALDAEEKGLFLDIACFFKGERRDFVEGILEDKPISGLLHKSLVTIEDGEIHMHDLIQEMGRVIVLRSTQRSRLWIAKDVSDVLENNKGTEAIEGIYLPLIEDEVHLRADVFEDMRKLRLLKFYYFWYGKVKFYDGDLKCLPNSLRYLHWEYYPGKSLPSNFEPQYLVELHMPCSKLVQLWDGIQELGRLKHINLFKSRLLTKIPDLSRAPKLESINLSCCESLSHIPSLNLNLQATVDESAFRHQWLSVEVDYFEFEAERTPGCIILNGCLGLTTFPKVGGNIRKLVLRRTPMEELPSSIESLENLLLLDSSYCYNLKSLPKLPRNIEVLVLNFSGIEQIPSSSIEGLCSLRILSTGYCEYLEFIPETIGKLTRLQRLSLSGCSRLESLPMLSGLCCLTELDLSFCNIREIPASIGMLYMLKRLSIERCKNLQSLPELPLFIEYVCARGCSSLEMVSTLRSTLTLGRWLDKNDSDNDRREFLFEDCRNLCENAINNIFREFLYKVFCTATTPPEVVHAVSEIVIGNLVVCYPTKEIPRWFNNQSEGSSITITLPPNWYNPKTFLGFVVSVIVVDEDAFLFPSSVECILHLRTDTDRFRVDDDDYGYIFSSHLDHIVMWYNYFDHSKVNFEKEYIEASFEFESRNLKVKRCGFRMLYLRDAAEKSDDGTTANFESWIIDVNDSHSASDVDDQSVRPSPLLLLLLYAVAVDPSLHKYDVFISFSGDTRNSFTSHLYSALCQKRIKAYIDKVSLEKGDDIRRALPKAIQESEISIIIFSEDYASSRWCLDELVQILKCREEKDQVVLPIFHGIDPSDVRKQRGVYAAACDEHEKRFKDKMDRVEEWRQALRRAADLIGWDSRCKYETVIVEEVVEDVIRILKSNLKGFVGIRNITKVKPKYHVFISFNGEDTRKGFTRHLYSTLCHKRIKAYLDEVSLEKGDEISHALLKVIEESAISIIIFSENYAFSSWNLNELVHILKCMRMKNQIVLPIFHGIDPSDVRKQRGVYAAAFDEHEKRFKDKMDRVEEWRQALKEAAGLSGWDSLGMSESVLVQEVVEAVMRNLESVSPISMADLKGNITSWQKGELLGCGSFGSVYEGIAEEGFFIAVKEVSLLDAGSQESIYQLQQKIALLSQFEHENIVQYYGTDKDESKLYIFLELVTKGSLRSLYQNPKYILGDTQVSSYTRQILQGLKYLHDRNVVHGDIKCANILVDASGSVKLADFGLAKATKLNDVKSCKGTPLWMAPEVVNTKKQGYGLPADIWSLGCTVLEMLTRKFPYSELEGFQALFRIGHGVPPSVPDSLSNDARDFIWKCLQVNPDARATAAELLNHSFVHL